MPKLAIMSTIASNLGQYLLSDRQLERSRQCAAYRRSRSIVLGICRARCSEPIATRNIRADQELSNNEEVE